MKWVSISLLGSLPFYALAKDLRDLSEIKASVIGVVLVAAVNGIVRLASMKK